MEEGEGLERRARGPEGRSLGLGGGMAYLAGLDTVDQHGIWVPSTLAGAHNALTGETKRTENKQK